MWARRRRPPAPPDQAPLRLTTVLIYLTDIAEGTGGETVFPCFAADAGAAGALAFDPDLCATLQAGEARRPSRACVLHSLSQYTTQETISRE